MFSWDNPEDRVTIVQMNSELRNAHLELLSAHCATHQLRLHYAMEDLVRFGQRDVLQKSVQAASALNDYYELLERKIAGLPAADPDAVPVRLSEELLVEGVECLVAYLREQRQRHLPSAETIAEHHKVRLRPYFDSDLLEKVRVAERRGARLSPPQFYARAKALGIENLPEISHMDSLTFLDVVVFNEVATLRALFHALVHVVQFEILGVERYAQLFVRSFANTQLHVTVPLESHAFQLEARFARRPPEMFWVADEVLGWVEKGKYEM